MAHVSRLSFVLFSIKLNVLRNFVEIKVLGTVEKLIFWCCCEMEIVLVFLYENEQSWMSYVSDEIGF